MKKITILFVCMVLITSVNAQTATKDLIENELTRMLIDGNVLLDSARIKAEQKKIDEANSLFGKEKKRISKAFLKNNEKLHQNLIVNFNYPDDGMEAKLIDSLSFKGTDVVEFGSYIIKDQDKFSKSTFPGTTRAPELPILTQNAQFGIPASHRSNYQLYASLNYLMSLYNKTDGEVEASFFSSAAQSSLEKTKSESKTLSVGYGIFRNQLAHVFRKAINEEPFEFTNEFIPLIKVWQLYSDSAINGNSRILGSFKGLVIYKTNKTSELSSTDFSGTANLKINTPFVSLSNETKANWSKSRTSRTEENNFDIYMTEAPSDFQDFPSAEKIMVAWNQFSSYIELPRFVDPVTYINLSESKIHEIVLTFGPVDDYYGNQVYVDKGFTIEALKEHNVIADIRRAPERPVINNETGMMYYKIQIVPNDKFISTYSKFETEKFYKTIPIRLYIKDSLKSGSTSYSLDRYYNVESRVETYPLPYLTSKLSYEIENNKYKVKVPLSIKINDMISEVKIDTIIFRNGRNAKLSEAFLQNVNSEKEGNNFTISMSSNLDSTIFNFNSNLNAKIELYVITADRKYPREINVRFPYEHVLEKASESLPEVVEIPTGIELESILDMGYIIENNVNIAEFRNRFIKNGELDTLSFNSALVNKLNIQSSILNASYLVDSTLIDKDKYIESVRSSIKFE